MDGDPRDKDAAAVSVRTAINLIRLFAAPLVADHSLRRRADGEGAEASIRRALHWPKGKIADELTALKPGHAFDVPPVLFAKISPEQIAAWEARFGGADQ